MTRILRIDAGARREGSVSRRLADRITARLVAAAPGATVTVRDLAETPAPLLTEAWIGGAFSAPEARTAEQAAAIATSDALVEELRAADTLVIALPVYNFGVPAAFKAWFDQVARAGVTFRYTENGPVGLLDGKRAIVAVATGGTEVGSAIDFATPWVRHVLGFIGIHDVEIVAADRTNRHGAEAIAAAEARIDALAA